MKINSITVILILLLSCNLKENKKSISNLEIVDSTKICTKLYDSFIYKKINIDTITELYKGDYKILRQEDSVKYYLIDRKYNIVLCTSDLAATNTNDTLYVGKTKYSFDNKVDIFTASKFIFNDSEYLIFTFQNHGFSSTRTIVNVLLFSLKANKWMDIGIQNRYEPLLSLDPTNTNAMYIVKHNLYTNADFITAKRIVNDSLLGTDYSIKVIDYYFSVSLQDDAVDINLNECNWFFDITCE